ncbi:PPE family protein [Candidatus Mycobacterium methanotrophicum]|uniref:PPE domain-containing protein n=1 Tax=Candidatus Mycobacterium methanotrophicum TaxID=2943498 RepID=A0ABY4QTM7_9MYCO|nr:PPE family protein [Candidatus Mycobacterium methanotrophicum]UQX13075.1 PPE domain-containing protein [Candidatus Mycobacterium methanotrophicum]
MISPAWMASPPEVHSALLSSGPGPGSLTAAAGAWNSLSTGYASVAEELAALLAAVQAGAWEGPSAERYVAAHLPFLAWLVQASAKSASMAVQHEAAATAYTAALAAMPTLPELAANHTVHGVLLATNFFGINTVPIALNEADYARMWIQAATTMSTYEAVSDAAVASAPRTDPAPQIVSYARPADGEFGGGGDNGMLPIIDNDAGDPYALSWWINRLLEVPQTLWRDVELIAKHPAQGFTQLFADIGGLASDEFGHALQAVEYFPQLLALPLAVPAAAAGGVAGLGGLAGIQVEAATAPAVSPPVPTPQPHGLPLAANSPAAMGFSTSPGTTTASAPAPSATSVVSSAATPTPAGGGAGFVPPYAVGPPGIGVDSGMNSRASSGAKKKGSEPEAAAAAAVAAAAQVHRRTRQRRRAAMRANGHEFMEAHTNVDPDWGVPDSPSSDRGAGPLGFAGTVGKETAPAAAGLTTLADDEFGSGPQIPMLPNSWDRAGKPAGCHE